MEQKSVLPQSLKINSYTPMKSILTLKRPSIQGFDDVPGYVVISSMVTKVVDIILCNMVEWSMIFGHFTRHHDEL